MRRRRRRRRRAVLLATVGVATSLGALAFLSDVATEHPPRRLLLQEQQLPQLPPAAASAVSVLLDLRRRIWPYFRDEDLGAGTGGLFAADRQLNAYFSVLLNLWNAVFGVQGLRLTPFGDLPTFTLYAPWREYMAAAAPGVAED